LTLMLADFERRLRKLENPKKSAELADIPPIAISSRPLVRNR
jgi:hypothetical protein